MTAGQQIKVAARPCNQTLNDNAAREGGIVDCAAYPGNPSSIAKTSRSTGRRLERLGQPGI
jgi:hypothetical protein